MKSCQHFNDPAACLAHRELIVTYRQEFRIPLPRDSMCANCRRTRPEKDRTRTNMDALVSEELLGRMRKAGAV